MNVTGLLTGTLGLGEAARGYVRALQAAEHPGVHLDRRRARVRDSRRRRRRGLCARRLHRPRRRRRRPASTWSASTPTSCRAFAESVGEEFFWSGPRSASGAGRPITSRSAGATRSACSTRSGSTPSYVAENLGARRADPGAAHSAARVAAGPRSTSRSTWASPSGFRFLFMFDFFSTIQRKNPVGLIEAFRSAFEPGEGPQLVREDDQRRAPPAGARGGAVGGARATRRARHRPFAERPGTRRPAGRVRLLRVAAPQRGLRPHARRVHGARQAGDRHGVLGHDRLHDRGEQLSRPLRDDARRRRLRDLPRRGHMGGARRRRGGAAHARASSSTRTRRARRASVARARHRAALRPGRGGRA